MRFRNNKKKHCSEELRELWESYLWRDHARLAIWSLFLIANRILLRLAIWEPLGTPLVCWSDTSFDLLGSTEISYIPNRGIDRVHAMPTIGARSGCRFVYPVLHHSLTLPTCTSICHGLKRMWPIYLYHVLIQHRALPADYCGASATVQTQMQISCRHSFSGLAFALLPGVREVQFWLVPTCGVS
jgi:hypothetical protein